MSPTVSPEQVRQITQTVLRRPEFQQSVDPWPSLIQWLIDKFLRLTSWSQANPSLARLLTIGLFIILVLLLLHLTLMVRREFKTLRQPGSPIKGRHLRALEGTAENWNEALILAKAAVESGDLYRALWITHRVLLSALDRLGLVKFARWKTNNDYLRECGSTSSASETLGAVSTVYERVVYAHSAATREDVVRLLNRVETLAMTADQ